MCLQAALPHELTPTPLFPTLVRFHTIMDGPDVLRQVPFLPELLITVLPRAHQLHSHVVHANMRVEADSLYELLVTLRTLQLGVAVQGPQVVLQYLLPRELLATTLLLTCSMNSTSDVAGFDMCCELLFGEKLLITATFCTAVGSTFLLSTLVTPYSLPGTLVALSHELLSTFLFSTLLTTQTLVEELDVLVEPL